MTAKRGSPALDNGSRLACLVAVAAAVSPLASVLSGRITTALLALLAVAATVLWRGMQPGVLVRMPLTLGATALVMVEYGVGFGGGFGRDTAATLLAAMLVLKLLELRNVRDGRAALSLSLFAILAAFLQDRGPLILTMSLLATLLVLAVLARMAELETPARMVDGTLQLPRRLGASARLALYSLPLAVVGFFLFPRLASPLWALPQNSDEARSGLSETMSPGDISTLFLDDTPIMRVRFDGPVPAQSQLYWRGPVLSQFDGRQWSRAAWLYGEPVPEIIASGPALSYQIEQEATERRYIFALDLPIDPGPDQRLTFERSLMARRALIDVSRLELRSQPDYRLHVTMNRTLQDVYSRLPNGYNPRTIALAEEWREAGAEDAEVIRRALRWFNAEFTYTLSPPLLGRDSADDFLFNTRSGYCEHFASAFTVLMRAAGIPARVVTGYQGGYRNAIGGYLVVLQSDAHAWSEVWLPDQGWVRIDPTSAVAPERIDPAVDAAGGSGRSRSNWSRTVIDAVDWMRSNWNEVVLGFDAVQQSQLLRPLGIEKADWRQLAGALIAAALLSLVITMALLLRTTGQGKDALGRAYGRFLQRLAKAGASKSPSEGQLAFAERVAGNFPASAADIASLSMRYVRQRYAPQQLDPQALRALCTDLRRFRISPEDRT